MNLSEIEQATGAKLEAGRIAQHWIDTPLGDGTTSESHLRHLVQRSDEVMQAALAERDALIMRLVGELSSLRNELSDYHLASVDRAEQAEARASEMSAAYTFESGERVKAEADLATVTAERDACRRVIDAAVVQMGVETKAWTDKDGTE